jgi:hypothetical protein
MRSRQNGRVGLSFRAESQDVALENETCYDFQADPANDGVVRALVLSRYLYLGSSTLRPCVEYRPCDGVLIGFRPEVRPPALAGSGTGSPPCSRGQLFFVQARFAYASPGISWELF